MCMYQNAKGVRSVWSVFAVCLRLQHSAGSLDADSVIATYARSTVTPNYNKLALQ